MGLTYVSIQRFKVELQLPQVLRHELPNLQLNGHEARELAVEEEQVEYEIPAADLERHLASDEAEVAPELRQELTHVLDKGEVQVGFTVAVRQAEKLDEVSVTERRFGTGMDFSQCR